jgi:hypothetical protein
MKRLNQHMQTTEVWHTMKGTPYKVLRMTPAFAKLHKDCTCEGRRVNR